MTVRDDIAFLVGSDSRVAILRELHARESRPTELAEACSCARETAQRTLAGFVDRGWVVSTESRYRLTPGGEMVLDAYEHLSTAVDTADRLAGFLAHAGHVVGDLSPTTLVNQRVTIATAANPHAPVDRYLSIIEGEPVDELRAISPIVSRVFNEATEEVLGPDTTAELVIDESVLRTSREQYPTALQKAHDMEGFTLLLSPESLDFGLGIIEKHVFVPAYDEQGNLVASLDGTDADLLEWAEAVYERYRERARVLDPHGAGSTV